MLTEDSNQELARHNRLMAEARQKARQLGRPLTGLELNEMSHPKAGSNAATSQNPTNTRTRKQRIIEGVKQASNEELKTLRQLENQAEQEHAKNSGKK